MKRAYKQFPAAGPSLFQRLRPIAGIPVQSTCSGRQHFQTTRGYSESQLKEVLVGDAVANAPEALKAGYSVFYSSWWRYRLGGASRPFLGYESGNPAKFA
jgi:hypothetical protein